VQEPIELKYIEPFFKSLEPKAVAVVGKDYLVRFVCNDPDWSKVVGVITDTKVQVLRVRAKYRIFKELERRKLITFCKVCNNVIGSKVIDGFNRPWENICAECFSSNSE